MFEKAEKKYNFIYNNKIENIMNIIKLTRYLNSLHRVDATARSFSNNYKIIQKMRIEQFYSDKSDQKNMYKQWHRKGVVNGFCKYVKKYV